MSLPRLVLTSTSSPHLRTARPEAPAQGLRADTVRHTRPASTPQGILPSWGATTRGRCLTLPHSLVGEAWPGSGRKTRSGLRATPLGWKPERRRRGPALRAPARRLRSNAGLAASWPHNPPCMRGTSNGVRAFADLQSHRGVVRTGYRIVPAGSSVRTRRTHSRTDRA